MWRLKHVLWMLLVVAAVSNPASAAPILVGQQDTFESGPEGWHFGGGPVGIPMTFFPTVPTGGPGGVDDAFLRMDSTGSAGPGGRLSGINVTQWAGDYSGVGGISLDLNNLGPTELSIRLLIAAPPFGIAGPENVVITPAFTLGAGSGWVSHAFSLDPSDLILLAGSVDAALANAFELRIFHNPAPGFPPPAAVASLGVDNITAVASVPEPATILLLTGGVAAFGWNARRRRLTD